MNHDDVLSRLGENKVNLNIKTNKMNEMDVFRDGGEVRNAFSNFDNIFGTFKNKKCPSICNIKINTPAGTVTRTYNGDINYALASMPPNLANTIGNVVAQAMEVTKQLAGGVNEDGSRVYSKKMLDTMERHQKEREERKKDLESRLAEVDPLLYTIASYIDKTLPLFSQVDINKKVNDFRDTLLENLKNHIDAYRQFNFKAKKISIDDVIKSLNKGRENIYPVIYYASNLLKSNIVCEEVLKKNEVIVEYGGENDNYIYMRDDGKEAEDHPEGFRSYIMKHIDKVISHYDNKNLKKMLVKDLKVLACELKIDIYKVVDTVDAVTGKQTVRKTALLKDELVEKISSLINRSI